MSHGPEPAAPRLVVLVTGLSGAGRTSILRALEDVGYEAVDNPPLSAIEGVIAAAGEERPLAIGVDVRARGFDTEAALAVFDRLRANPALRTQLVFAWADETALLRRYTETRRRHPLAPEGRVIDGIAAERQHTAPLHAIADWIVDTTDLPLPELRRLIEARFAVDQTAAQPALSVTLISFAYPAGLPREADLVFDARFLRNPHYVPDLRPLTGSNPAVAAYVMADPDWPAFLARVTDLLALLLPRFVQEGKRYATIAIGCTGGRHRSVTVVERLASYLTETGWRVTITHRELAREGNSTRPEARRGEESAPPPAPAAAQNLAPFTR
jgi:UPF0042 nucleotide-binding protein